MGDAVGDGGVDGVLRDIALGAPIVAAPVARQRSSLPLHLVGRLPGTHDDLADAPHGLGVRGEHADGPQIVEDILGGDGLGADARLGEGEVLRDPRVQVVTHHEHVQMLVHGVHGEGHGRVGRGRQAIGLAADPDDVGRVAASRAFRVIGVDGAALERADGFLHEPRLVQRVGVDRHLDVHLLGHRQAGVDGGGGRPPVFVELEPDGARLDLFPERIGPRGIPLAEKAEVDREPVRCLEHPVDVPGARRAGRGIGPGGGAGAAAD